MAYFDENPNWNPTSAAGWFDIHPDLTPTLDPNLLFCVQGNAWGMAQQPDPMVGPPTDILGPGDYAGLNTIEDGCDQPSDSVQHWTESESHSQPVGLSGWDASLVGPAQLETSAIVPVPSSAPLGYWGECESGFTFGTFCQQNVYVPHQLGTGPTRTELGQERRFQPYGTRRARVTEHINAEAGPSTLPPPRISPVGPPTTPPPGGLSSETTANAVTNQPQKEEDRALETPALKLRKWAQRLKGPGSRRPSLRDAVAAAAKVIPQIRPEMYQDQWLRMSTAAAATNNNVTTKVAKERIRRKAARASCGELSRYYPRAVGEWSVADLLETVVRDLEAHPDLRPIVRESTSEATTSATAGLEQE